MEGSLPHREEGRSEAAPQPWPRRVALVAAGLGLSAALSWGVPPLLRDLFQGVGRAVCHQWPAHSLFLGGWQLPLCARCTGTFLGAAVSLLALVWRGRSRTGNLPPVGILATLLASVAAWGVDGMNSFLSLLPGAPHLYTPNNFLRLATGLLNGTALVHLALPVVNLTLWKESSPDPSLQSWGELGSLLAVLAACGALVLWGPGWLYGPVAFWSILGVLALLTLVNTVIATVLLGREGAARSARQLAVPLAAATLLTAAEVAAIVALRGWLEARVGLGW